LLHELSHGIKAGARSAFALTLLLAFMLCNTPSAFAQLVTGTIQGTVTSSQANKKLAGVQVTATAPSGRYTATTDPNGFFNISGVATDTYTVQFRLAGYETVTVSGLTVTQGQVANASTVLSTSLTQIGRTQARSTGGAFQPTQTTDTYNISTQQISTTLGKQGGTSETNLLASIPGASFDNSGYPVLRGGRENEEGFQYEGIDYTDAFTRQFINSLILNGAGNFQVTPGAGDASIGNVGTGAINIVAKRGTNPHFGQLEGDIMAGRYEHQLRGEYGWASPNGRYSDYASTVFARNAYNYGGGIDSPLNLGLYFTGRTMDQINDVTNNFVYKFGRDNSQSLQFFYDNTQFNLFFGLGSSGRRIPFPTNDALWLQTARGNTGIPTEQIQALVPFVYGQRSLTDTLPQGRRQALNGTQPGETFKLQYANNLNSTTFVTMKYYKVNAVTLFDRPNLANSVVYDDYAALQGGLRTGLSLDGTKQLTDKHLLGFGGKYEFLTPVFSQPSATGAFYNYGGFGNTLDAADFLPATGAPGTPPGYVCAYTSVYGVPCGYLFSQGFTGVSKGNGLFVVNGAGCPAASVSAPTNTNVCGPLPAAIPLPYADESTHTTRQDFAFYVKDTFSPTDRLKFDIGVRMDGTNWQRPACDINWCLPTSFTTQTGHNTCTAAFPCTYQFNYDADTVRPRVWQPRASFSWQFARNDQIRGTYGRSVQFAPIADTDVTQSDTAFNAFYHTPSHDPATGTAATFCGTSIFLGFADQRCPNYGRQLWWENATFGNGVPIQPLKPTTYNNYDVTYSHQFPHQLSVKITPFYTKAFNQVAQVAQPIVKNGVVVTDPVTGAPLLGPPVASNLGKNQTTGVEFFMTKEAAYGLSGSLSLTYQNEFSNVVPGSASEDFFPSIPPESLQLGNLYRVGFLSPFVGALAVQERTRTGWRINPVIYYNHGYPYGVGLLTAASVNGVPYNLPNTNVTNSSQLGGTTGATRYVDPRNPGSMFAPNIDATRGTPETAAAGGVLSASRIGPTQLTIEYTSPRNPKAGTFGALIQNVFNQLYAQPTLNGRYQPIATGIAGPYSGYSSSQPNPFFYGVRNFLGTVRGNQAYTISPTNQPRTVFFYYQLNL
jgi:Carboxypeptidase regulatory-like domain/TonB dependent receptor